MLPAHPNLEDVFEHFAPSPLRFVSELKNPGQKGFSPPSALPRRFDALTLRTG